MHVYLVRLGLIKMQKVRAAASSVKRVTTKTQRGVILVFLVMKVPIPVSRDLLNVSSVNLEVSKILQVKRVAMIVRKAHSSLALVLQVVWIVVLEAIATARLSTHVHKAHTTIKPVQQAVISVCRVLRAPIRLRLAQVALRRVCHARQDRIRTKQDRANANNVKSATSRMAA